MLRAVPYLFSGGTDGKAWHTLAFDASALYPYAFLPTWTS